MEMDRLQRSMISFFKYFHSFCPKWEEVLKKYEKVANFLCNQIEQLTLIQSVLDENLLLLQIPMLKENLIGKIHTTIEQELQLLNQLCAECKTMSVELWNQWESLRALLENTDCVPIEGTAVAPAPALLAEWAEDVVRYYHTLYLQVSSALLLLDYKDPDCTQTLKDATKEDPDLRKYIQRILAYTQFMLEDG